MLGLQAVPSLMALKVNFSLHPSSPPTMYTVKRHLSFSFRIHKISMGGWVLASLFGGGRWGRGCPREGAGGLGVSSNDGELFFPFFFCRGGSYICALLIIIITIKVFLNRKILSLETILSAHTHTHRGTHTHTSILTIQS